MNQFAVLEARPPYVDFEERMEVDPVATAKEGRTMMKSVDFAIIRPLGSKDTVEKEVLTWFQQIEQQARAGTYDKRWVKAYKEAYAEFKEGREPTALGMPIAQWAQISKAEAENLRTIGCRSVEDLAQWPDGDVFRLGMGGQSLKQKAKAWLQAGEQGKAATQIENLTVENDELKRTVAKLMVRLEKLELAADDEEPAPRRKRKASQEDLTQE